MTNRAVAARATRLPERLQPLETARLRLRPMGSGDAEALFRIYGCEEVMRYASEPLFPDLATVTTMLASVQRLLADGLSLEWAIVDKQSDLLIGTCGLHGPDAATASAEVGCLLARAAWGRGLMREALVAVLGHARDDLGVLRLRAEIDAPNVRSIRLFGSLGFAPVGDGMYRLELRAPVAPGRPIIARPDSCCPGSTS